MKIQRCPECGIRLKTNYCDICMKRVPFTGMPAKQTFQHVEGSSAHREEKHDCIDFGEPIKKKPKAQIHFPREKKAANDIAKKKGAVIGIVLAVMSLITPLFGLVEEAIDSVAVPEPEYNYEEYVAAGESGAEEAPGIQPMELYNDGQILITADSAGFYYDDYTISVTIQNGSEQDIDVSTELLSVNGYMVSYGLYSEVEAGETKQDFLTLYSYELEDLGIEQVAQVAFYLDIYDSDEYIQLATTDLITLETDAAQDYVQPVETSGWELYNDGSVKVLLTGAEFTSYGEYNLDVYIENVSTNVVTVSAPALYINGQEISGYLWNTLRPDTRVLESIYIYDLDEQGITVPDQVEELTMELHIEYLEDWDAWIVAETVNEAITLSPEVLRPYMN